ncbi:MAG TPA: hypothetical protein VGC09_03330 [Rhodopila sp.]
MTGTNVMTPVMRRFSERHGKKQFTPRRTPAKLDAMRPRLDATGGRAGWRQMSDETQYETADDRARFAASPCDASPQ